SGNADRHVRLCSAEAERHRPAVAQLTGCPDRSHRLAEGDDVDRRGHSVLQSSAAERKARALSRRAARSPPEAASPISGPPRPRPTAPTAAYWATVSSVTPPTAKNGISGNGSRTALRKPGPPTDAGNSLIAS